MKNQRGFVTLEMILVILIIAVLSTIALPKAARMIDAVRLDYEMKIFLSTLDFTKSLNKSAFYQNEIFDKNKLGDYPNALQVNITDNAYQIFRNSQEVFDPHKLPEGFTFTGMNQIYFSRNNNGHITITSPKNFHRYIIFNSVGRWRGDITAPK